ncbi:MAG TPA: hypothetical protein VFV07_12235 [Rhizomicrobium sp.]|nr:hypothetical protein [Rhizomicrobium sp.]
MNAAKRVSVEMARDFEKQLSAIASAGDFAERSEDFTSSWIADGAGLEAVDAVLSFMEAHPEIEYGMPGALVRFVERSSGKGYEERLLKSISRRPTAHTIWMLNRLINGSGSPADRQEYIGVMRRAKESPTVDPAVAARIDHFLSRLSPGE